MIKEEITKERIEDRIKDLEHSARAFANDLESYAMQQALKQMQVKEKNTDLLDEVLFYENEGEAYAMAAAVKGNGIVKSLVKLRDAWITMQGFNEDEVKEIIENSKKNLEEKVNKHIKKMDEKEGE